MNSAAFGCAAVISNSRFVDLPNSSMLSNVGVARKLRLTKPDDSTMRIGELLFEILVLREVKKKGIDRGDHRFHASG